MTKVIAKHLVVRTVEGKKQEVAPGTSFDATADELKTLEPAGAVRRPEKGETAQPAAEPAASTEKPEGNGGDDPVTAKVVKTEGKTATVEVGEITFETPANTVRDDGSLTPKGLENYEAAKAEAEQSGGDDLV